MLLLLFVHVFLVTRCKSPVLYDLGVNLSDDSQHSDRWSRWAAKFQVWATRAIHCMDTSSILRSPFALTIYPNHKRSDIFRRTRTSGVATPEVHGFAPSKRTRIIASLGRDSSTIVAPQWWLVLGLLGARRISRNPFFE